MAYGSPANPVSGTVITVAYAVTNLLDPIRWLRLLTGNADPPGSSYVVVSDSVTGTTWRKIPNDAIADGAITRTKILDGEVTYTKLAAGAVVAHLGYTPVNKSGDTMTGRLTVVGATGTGNNLDGVDIVQQSGGNSGAFMRFVTPSGAMVLGFFYGNAVFNVIDHNGTNAFTVPFGSTHAQVYGQTIWDSGNLTPSAITAGDTALLNGQPGTYYRARANHTGTQLAATISDFAAVVATLPAASAASATNFSGSLAGHVTGTQGATVVNGGNAATVGGLTPTTSPGPGRIPISDAAGTLNTWVTGTGIGVQLGIVAMVRTAAEIPAGWTRETLLDGLIPVGAGTSFGVPHDEGTAYGSSWSHQHAATGLTFSGTFTGTAATIAASGATNQANVTTPNPDFSQGSHTHAYTPAGSVGGSVSGNVASAAWLIPSRAYVFVRKTS